MDIDTMNKPELCKLAVERGLVKNVTAARAIPIADLRARLVDLCSPNPVELCPPEEQRTSSPARIEGEDVTTTETCYLCERGVKRHRYTPELQNIPIRTEEGRAIREAFASPGVLSTATDFSQMERRTHLSSKAAAILDLPQRNRHERRRAAALLRKYV